MKYFCDECDKQLRDHEEVRIDYRKERWKSYMFCLECFQKHWQEPLPKEKE